MLLRIDGAEVDEFFLREELTDGLPIVVPTVERVEAALEYVDSQGLLRVRVLWKSCQ